MEYIHIKNLEKYNPGYTDRNLIWCKIYFSMLNSSYDFDMIDDIDKWRLIALIMLELQMKKPIPWDEKWLQSKISTNKRPISLTLKMLHNFIEPVTTDEGNLYPRVEKNRIEKSREEKSRETDAYSCFEKLIFNQWNIFSAKHDLPKVQAISESRRKHLKERFRDKDFDINNILKFATNQDFLFGKNGREWKMSLDWLISNDTNYLKILENKYFKPDTGVLKRLGLEQ